MIRSAHIVVALALGSTLAFAAPAGAKPQRVPKGWAKKHHVAKALRDGDRDGLSNWGEWRSGTDPRKRDSDHDGVRDGAEDRDHDGLRNADEVALGTDPRTRDSDHDGQADGREDFGVSGTVTALSGSSLTLRLDNGALLGARLDADAAVYCEDEAGAQASQVDPGDDSADDTGDDTGEDTGDDGSDDFDSTGDDTCTGALAVGAAVEAELTAGPGGLTVASVDVL